MLAYASRLLPLISRWSKLILSLTISTATIGREKSVGILAIESLVGFPVFTALDVYHHEDRCGIPRPGSGFFKKWTFRPINFNSPDELDQASRNLKIARWECSGLDCNQHPNECFCLRSTRCTSAGTPLRVLVLQYSD